MYRLMCQVATNQETQSQFQEHDPEAKEEQQEEFKDVENASESRDLNTEILTAIHQIVSDHSVT